MSTEAAAFGAVAPAAADGPQGDDGGDLPEVSDLPEGEGVEAPESAELGGDKPEDDPAASVKHKVKVDGKEVEVTLKELRDGYQRQADYTKKTMELAKERREVTKLQAQIKHNDAQIKNWVTTLQGKVGDPDAFVTQLERAGVPARKVLMKYLEERIEDERLSPQEKFQREQERFRRTKQQDEQERQRRLQEAEMSEATKRMASQFKAWWPKALQEAALPNTKFAHDRVKAYLRPIWEAGRNATYNDLTEAAKLAAADLRAEKAEYLKTLDHDALIEELGEEGARKFMAAAGKKLATKKAPPAATQAAGRTVPRPPSNGGPPKFRTMTEEMAWRNGGSR